jgi:hypothetical protein
MNAKVPMMLQGNFKPGFKIDLHIKDLANALDTGHGVGAPLPLTAAIMEMMQTLKADGCGQNDHSALAKYYAKVSGTNHRLVTGFSILQQHGNDFAKVGLEFVEGLRLRMSAGKTGHVAHEQPRVRVAFDNGGKILHGRIILHFKNYASVLQSRRD